MCPAELEPWFIMYIWQTNICELKCSSKDNRPLLWEESSKERNPGTCTNPPSTARGAIRRASVRDTQKPAPPVANQNDEFWWNQKCKVKICHLMKEMKASPSSPVDVRSWGGMLLRFCQGTKVCSPRIAQECREEQLCSHSCRRQSGTTIACEIAKSVQTPEVGVIEDILAINIGYIQYL